MELSKASVAQDLWHQAANLKSNIIVVLQFSAILELDMRMAKKLQQHLCTSQNPFKTEGQYNCQIGLESRSI